jgi:hypothetical protein
MDYLDHSLRTANKVTLRRTSPLEFAAPRVPAHGSVTFEYDAIVPGT